MSRYELAPKQHGLEVAVGWDPAMETFFGQVQRPGRDEDETLLWIGSTPREVARAEDLVAPLKPYADLKQDVIDRLRADHAKSLDKGPTKLQRLANDFFRGPR